MKSTKSIYFRFLSLFLVYAISFLSSCTGPEASKKVIFKSNNPILPNDLMIIYQDKQNNHWFGTKANGIYKYDGNKITHYDQNNGLNAKGIKSIQEDSAGKLFFETDKEIISFDGNQFETLAQSKSKKNEWKLSTNDLWFKGNTNKNGPLRFDGDSLYQLEFPKHILEDEFYLKHPNSSFSPYGIYTIYKDSHQNIWFGTSTFGASRFDGSTISWISENETIEMDDGPAPGVRSILEDDKGYFWFNCNIKYKYKIRKTPPNSTHNKIYQKLKGINLLNKSRMHYSSMAMIQDEKSNIWMATYDDGVWKYDGENLIQYPVFDGKKAVLIFTIYKDNQNNVWLGTQNAGAYKFNGTKFVRFNVNSTE